MKRIVSLWLPAWPITRLKRQVPAAVPSREPFALVDLSRRGIVITAVNGVAAREGVTPGTMLADARAALPGLRARPAERDEDYKALFKLMRWAGRYGPGRNSDADDSFWIDISGVAHLYGGEDKLLDDLCRRLTDFSLPARAGLADTLGCAHALARFVAQPARSWALAPEGGSQAALAHLPVEALRLDDSAVLLLKRLGLRRVGQLYDLPRESLARRFRSSDVAGAVLTRLDQALGVSAEPLRSCYEPPALAVRRNFAEPVISSEALEAVAGELCDELAAALENRELGARFITLSLYRTDGTVAEARAGMRTPCRDGRHMMNLLKEKLAVIDAGFGIDAVALDAVNVEHYRGTQTGFSEVDGVASYDPGPLIDRLSNRLGPEAVTVFVARASHIPERRETRAPALALSPSPRRPKEGGGERGQPRLTYEPPWPYGQGPRRPPFVLARPEPISVVAEVPDGPPARFTWRRVERRVARAEGPERIAPEWWRAIGRVDSTKCARPRDYFEIEDETGAAYWVFRHGLYGGAEGGGEDDPPRWFLHGLFA